jgi:class 3 adenylate cyclase
VNILRSSRLATGNWNKDRAGSRIQAKIDSLSVKDIEIKPYVRDTDLSNLPDSKAYRVDGVHLYADILNLSDMLHVTDVEGEICHRRTLRFLNLQYRAVHRILRREEALLVDFHNQRLHSVIAKPYDDEKRRVSRAVAIGQLIIEVLAQTGEDADHPAAKVRIGIDTGKALAVSNGRRGHREPLFLGEPANHAAKRSGGGGGAGIFLTNKARKAIDLADVANEDASPLTVAEIKACQGAAKLGATTDGIVKEWKSDLSDHPIGKFEFSSHTPPFSNLDIEALSVQNSRRQDAATIYGDIDGFTAYVGANIGTDEDAKKVVLVLNVLRTELDAVLHEDFKGRKVRFIGDCIHGLLVEGTAQTTDSQQTIDNMTLCAAAMRSSFDLALEKLKANGCDAKSLGLQIGFEFGPMTVTQLGMKGELIRCSVSRGVLAAEKAQARCTGSDTAIGPVAFDAGSSAVQKIFGASRKRSDLTYDKALKELALGNTPIAEKAAVASSLLKPASAAASPFTFANRPAGPAKPAGFA